MIEEKPTPLIYCLQSQHGQLCGTQVCMDNFVVPTFHAVHINAYGGIIKAYSGLFRHILHPV